MHIIGDLLKQVRQQLYHGFAAAAGHHARLAQVGQETDAGTK
jgi:hypothetical protein